MHDKKPLAVTTLQPDRCAEFLRALSDPVRLRIIDALRQAPKCVSELAEDTGTDLAVVSHHLGILWNAKFVEKERQGRFIVYRLSERVYKPADSPRGPEHLDLGCCRIEMPKRAR
jgi:DNA-binding transcriptional ArsR family regulator